MYGRLTFTAEVSTSSITALAITAPAIIQRSHLSACTPTPYGSPAESARGIPCGMDPAVTDMCLCYDIPLRFVARGFPGGRWKMLCEGIILRAMESTIEL